MLCSTIKRESDSTDQMASTISFPRSLAKSYLTFRNFQNKCISASSFASKLFYFYRPHSQNPHLQLPLCTGRLLAHCPSRARSPSLRRSLSVMATPQASSNSKESSTKTERVVIKGRVQGVWYRNWTIDNATQLGLKGWVRNRKDGSVEALFSGSPEAVQEMEQRCRRGPPDAVVTGLEVFPSNDDPGTGFKRKPTV